MLKIGLRCEDKSEWEARVPLVPTAVARLIRDHGLDFDVQTSPNRAFAADQFVQAGARVADTMTDCPIVMGVKEIPPEHLEGGRTYIYFSHTIKGQPYNMPALRRLVDQKCTLIDYEKITDAQNRRLVFFGRFAGLAGMIDTLWALGRRLDVEGIANPFSQILPAHQYDDLAHAKREIAAVGERIRAEGLPAEIQPLVCGFAGYGQVSMGAQEIFDLLDPQEVAPADLPSVAASGRTCFKVVFKEEHLVDRIDASQPFELQEYYQHPDRYRAAFFPHVPHLTLLVNCIYWEEKYPRLMTKDQTRELYSGAQPPRLRVIGEITADIEGSIECMLKATDPGNPVFVYDVETGQARDGFEGNGPVVLAVDFLPCELPVDASNHFSEMLVPFMPAIAKADLAAPLAQTGLPPEIQRATILLRGEFTEPFKYMARFL